MIKLNMIKILVCMIFFTFIVFSQSEGFTVTSISTSDVITKTTEPSQVYWIVNTHFNGGGQHLTGTVTPLDVKTLTGGDYYTAYPFTISVTTSNEEIFYNVINEGVPIYRYEVQTFDGLKDCPLGFCYYYADAQDCPDSANWDIAIGRSTLGYVKKRVCVTKTQVAVKGSFENPTIGFYADIDVSASGTTKESRICSGASTNCDGSSVSFGNLGTASWTGSLVTGEPAPNQDNFIAINKLDSDKWSISRRSTFESYFPSIGDTDSTLNEIQNLYRTEDYSDSTIENYVQYINSVV
ncbi:hypothetical protein KKF81_02995, partial [Candidatus Micrarchaeota archaeon]|nr:hypothetical protein [Candidatus Micrarchaeota archaeon]